MSLSLEGRVAIVTGGAQGIGYGATKQLVGAGVKVIIVDVDAGQAESRVKEFGADRVSTFIADLYDTATPAALMAYAREQAGGIDIIVNNAGIHWDSLIQIMSDAQWQAVIDIHMTVPFRVLRAAAPHFAELAKADKAAGVANRYRKVVNISSGAAYGNIGAANYAAGKAGLLGLTKALAAEWRPLNVTVNAIAMGLVATRFGIPQSEQNRVQVGGYDVQFGVPPHTLKRMGIAVEEGRDRFEDADIYAPKAGPDGAILGGTIDDAGRAILDLCTPLSDYVAGEVHHVGRSSGYGIW